MTKLVVYTNQRARPLVVPPGPPTGGLLHTNHHIPNGEAQPERLGEPCN